ncbi:MAG TPA: cell surface protein SprA [Flavobacteriaceae bacterium]|nr:cell surface protein SprA [Flavobacteriaceae bacterium]
MVKQDYLNLPFKSVVLITFLIFTYGSVIAQEEEPVQDSTRTGNIRFENPSSIVSKYTYDPITNTYLYTEKVGDVNIKYPLTLTPDEFEERVREEEMKRYFKEKYDAVNARGDGNEEEQRNLLPIFYVNNDFFETIFGGTEIEIIPQGSVEVGLGVLFNKTDNPSLSPRNRSSFTFDFDQNINLSLNGHVGERLQITANYDTHSTFDFQNQIKLEYTPDEDDIVQKIELGNVNMPLSNSLIQGSQSLFGVKTELKFGKTRITGIYSEQNSERQQTIIEGGGAVEDFEKEALEYDENRHFFLAHYFRENYDKALENYPYINSNIEITRVQIWVTNRSNSPDHLTDARNIVGLQDLGESNPDFMGVFKDSEGNPINPPEYAGFINANPDAYPSNANNDFNPLGITGPQQSVLTPAIRDIATVGQGFGALSSTVDEGTDYAKLENARQLNQGEYTIHPKLGYISLRTRIRNDEMLAIAYEYTVNGQVYQVGEFGSDGVDASQPVTNPQDPEGQPIAQNKNLIVKLLKSPITNVKEPIWDLMMKNIYNLDANQLEQEDFDFNIFYTDPQPLNYITPVDGTTLPEDVDDVPLLRVFNLDKLNINQDPVTGGDGFFDFVPGITVDAENGRLIFTTVEPFGKHLFEKLQDPDGPTADYDDVDTYNENQSKYVFRSLYRSTKTQADQEDSDKNKFQLTGSYRSRGDEGIPIGSFNVPRGSVKVTAGGRELQEGVDYTVDYELGRVKIINEALKASDQPISVSTENNAVFGQRTKRFAGIHVDHEFNKNLLLGATFLNMNEKPQTHKSNYGYEPINNTMYGFNLNYSTEVPFFTRLVNKLPNIDTDVPSNLSVRGEFAYLQPGSPKGDNFGGETTSYVDDFEASQTGISVLAPHSWFLSSAPIGYGGEKANDDLASGYKRAKLNWYNIDPIFYSGQRPSEISDNDVSTYDARRIFKDEIFPDTDILEGDSRAIYSLDLAYYPNERGMYNYNPAAAGTNTLPNPEENFGGIMRGIENSDFEQTNVQYVEFWMMDPYVYNENANLSKGKIVFNLGSISEDVLKDGRKQYENGLPKDGSTGGTIETAFGRVPSTQSLVYAFDTEGEERANQDLGLDGLNNADEAAKFPAFANLDDPSNDDYEYYLQAEGGVVERYRRYNGLEGNSPSSVGQTNRGNTTEPSTEDVNRDNTMNTINSYFEYEVPIYPNMSVDNNTSSIAGVDQDYISDVRDINVTLQNGQEMQTRWVQFRVPLSTDSKYSIGGISDMRSIRFMRLFLTDFNQSTVLRFGTMDLVRGDYRKYDIALEPGGSDPETTSGTSFTSESVSQENNSGYVSPPGVRREELVNNNQRIREDEQSLALKVKKLAPNDMRAVYKNFQVDMRQFKNLKMFLHANSLPNPNPQLLDGDLTAFIRIGSDIKNNFYQIEIPLNVSPEGSTDKRDVWPEENEMNLPLELLQIIKSTIIGDNSFNMTDLNYFDNEGNPISANTITGEMKIAMKGNPSFGDVKVIMLGLKNTGNTDAYGEVWFNELRMTEMKNQGGWAANLNVDTNLADFMAISANGHKSTIGFGSIEQGPNARSKEDVKAYDVVTNVNAGQLLPDNWGLNIPLSYSRGEELITPQYDPEFKDIELNTLLDNTPDADDRDELRRRAEEYTRRQSVSVIGLGKQRTTDRTPLPIDIENFTFSGTYNQVDHRSFKIEDGLSQNVNVGATYDYGFAPWKFEPFKDIGFMQGSQYLAPIRDFNLSPLPNSISATGNILRQYNEQKFRQINLPEGSLGLPKLYQRDYRFNWGFTINDKITESLDFVFSISNNRIIRNYMDGDGVEDNTVGVWDDFFDLGVPNQHNQSLQVNYDLPFDKFPFLTFIRSQYSYTGNFQWQKGSEILRSLPDTPDLGNTIQNSRTHQINTTLTMKRLYDYIGLKKKRARPSAADSRANRLGFARGERSESRSNADLPESLSFGDKMLNTGINILTAINRVSVNYEETKGTFMPGYLQSVGFIGTTKPSAAFTFGSQSDIREMAARKGWLTLYQNFNQQYTTTTTKTLNLQTDIKLLPDLTIDLKADRVYADNYAENFRVSPEDLQYRSLTPHSFGNFSISTIMIGTAFKSSDENFSEVFQEFRDNRLEIANRLAEKAGMDLSDPSNINPETGYPVGFGRTSQQVLLPAFLSAYTGQDASKTSLGAFRDVPLPNWDLKYTGLMRIGFFRDNFNRFSLQHGYRAGYTINQFQTNLNYDRNDPYGQNNKDQNGNYRSERLISNVNLAEQFSPLIKVDFEMKNSISIMAQIDRDRALSLSFDNNLLTEIQGNEYKFGLGYRIKDMKITTQFEGQTRVLSSDLNLKADISYRRNKTIVRYLDINDSQVTTGQDRWQLSFTADYALSRSLTAIFYYDHNFSKYFVSTAFPQTTIRTGIKLRYTFGT